MLYILPGAIAPQHCYAQQLRGITNKIILYHGPQALQSRQERAAYQLYESRHSFKNIE